MKIKFYQDDLPNSVKFYFADFDTIFVNNNGCIGMGGSPDCSFYGTSPATSHTYVPQLDVAHDDMYYYSFDSEAGSYTYGTYIDHTVTSHADHGNGYFVSWPDHCHYSSSCTMYGEYDFSVAMFEDGTVLNIRKHNGYEIALEV